MVFISFSFSGLEWLPIDDSVTAVISGGEKSWDELDRLDGERLQAGNGSAETERPDPLGS